MSQTATPPTDYVLPKVPSQLIRDGLDDLESAEAADGVEVYMHYWHIGAGTYGRTCILCLAGAFMRSRLGVPDHETSSPSHFGDGEYQPLMALDAFRRGWVRAGLDWLDVPEPHPFGDRRITSYDSDPAAFKADMRKLADDLEAAGF